MNRLRPILYLIGGAALLYLVSLLFSDILVYIIISLIISTILRPLVGYLNSLYFYGYKLPKIFTILIAFSVFIGFIVLFVGLFIPLVSEQIQILSKLNYDNLYDRITTPIQSIEVFLMNSIPNVGEEGFIIDRLKESILSFAQTVDFSYIINNFISITGSIFVAILAVLFITFFPAI